MPRWKIIIARLGNGFLMVLSSVVFAWSIFHPDNPRVILLMGMIFIVSLITFFAIGRAARYFSEESKLRSAVREAELRRKLAAFSDP